MRICIQKSTGKLLSSQSGGITQEHLDTLLTNAISAGYSADDVEASFVTDDEFSALMESQKPAPTFEQRNAAVLAQLAANDAKILRALVENDSVRLAARVADQAALRLQLK